MIPPILRQPSQYMPRVAVFFKIDEVLGDSDRYNAWIYHNLQDDIVGDILDIGSGTGNVAKHYFDHPGVKRVVLSDYSDQMVAYLQKKFTTFSNFTALKLDISDDGSSSKSILNESLNTVICMNVLEHVEDDDRAVARMVGFLKDGGKLILLVPAFNLLYGTIDEGIGHYRRYDRSSLTAIVNKNHLSVEKVFFMNFLGFFLWFMIARVFRQKALNRTECRWFELLVPFLEGTEKICRPPFGQSLIMVCSKGTDTDSLREK